MKIRQFRDKVLPLIPSSADLQDLDISVIVNDKVYPIIGLNRKKDQSIEIIAHKDEEIEDFFALQRLSDKVLLVTSSPDPSEAMRKGSDFLYRSEGQLMREGYHVVRCRLQIYEYITPDDNSVVLNDDAT